MKITGIIAEYNPFHKGHAYHLAKTREATGADYVVVVQSGNFVQRGTPALADKHCRARMALLGGADLVLELPVAYACASAEGFASGAVSLLNKLGCVDALCFGSECGDLTRLSSCAKILADEPANYQTLLRAFLKQGLSFPMARSKAMQEYCSYESEILSTPNNTLGVEYIKALYQSGSSIQPFTIRRHSAGYHDSSLQAEFASATAIREALLSNSESPTLSALESVRVQLPEAVFRLLTQYLNTKLPLTLDDFSSLLFYQLLTLSEEELASYTDLTPELASRMKKLLPQFRSASSFADLLKTRQITHTRVTRALCHLLLKDKQEDAAARKNSGYPVYGRILGFRKESQALLNTIKKTASIPLLARPADGVELLKDNSLLLPLFQQDLFAAHLYEATAAMKSKTAICHEFTRQMTVL